MEKTKKENMLQIKWRASLTYRIAISCFVLFCFIAVAMIGVFFFIRLKTLYSGYSDRAEDMVYRLSVEEELSKNEFRILTVLLKNKAKVVSREKLMEALWETDNFVDENTLSVNVNRLRKRLSAAGLADFITTQFGVGYLIGD